MASGYPPEDFPVTHCTTCAREVLCYFDLDDRDCERLRCVHCSMPAEGAIRWLDARGLEGLGYVTVPAGEGCRPGECGTACGRLAAARA